MTLTIIVIVIVIIFIWFFIATYNSFIRLIAFIQNNLKQIDIQLDRRYKVFENLISVVKKYMDYEKTVLKDVVALRGQAQQAKDSGDSAGRMKAENEISKVLSGINVVFERYPDLKANQNAMQLQEEIVNTENKLAFAKQAYNDSVTKYNYTKGSIPQKIVVSMCSKLDKDFALWTLDEEARESKEEYQVKF
ncbi:MAG TPA: LemA family protein [Victivallales bacterium]|nr:LemA family protein [Victivallales bacterium]